MLRIGSWLSPKSKSIAVFLGAALFSLPGAVRLAQRVIELAPLTYEERRARVLGETYTSLRAIEKTLPPGDVNVALIGPNAIDRAIFINYHLYPRASHLYTTIPGRPLLVTEATGPVRRTIVKEPRASSDARREMIVPIVTSLQGGDGYATEAVIEGNTRVTLTLMPSRVSRTYAAPLVLGDVVRESFGVMTTGWLRVRADQPVRAAFWFVNRGRTVAAPIPVMTEVPASPQRIAGGEKLWVLNPSSAAITARVNGRDEVLAAGALREFSAQAMNEVEGAVIAFTSTKMPDGNTHWNAGVPPAGPAASRAAASGRSR